MAIRRLGVASQTQTGHQVNIPVQRRLIPDRRVRVPPTANAWPI
jgi:hypothetical protein